MSTTPMASFALDFLLDEHDLTAPIPGARLLHAGTPHVAHGRVEAPTPPPTGLGTPSPSPSTSATSTDAAAPVHPAQAASSSAPPPRRPHRRVLLPPCIQHRPLLVAPRPLVARQTLTRSPSPLSPMRIPCALASKPTWHNPWIASTFTLCLCRHYLAPFMMHCQTPIGDPLCKLSMMLYSPMTPGV
jgi:hypothetical protein